MTAALARYLPGLLIAPSISAVCFEATLRGHESDAPWAML